MISPVSTMSSSYIINQTDTTNISINYNDTATGLNGGVSSEHETCSEIGLEIMKSGGNAVDSAIATGICIGTVNLFSSGIGGGGFMLIRNNSGALVLNFRESAPQDSSFDMFRDNPFGSELGARAIAVPGEIKGYEMAHEMFGQISWRQLFQPSISLSRRGFPVTLIMETRIASEWKHIVKDEALKSILSNSDGSPKKRGDIIYRPRYAKALDRIAEFGSDGFYKGEIADDIVSSVADSGGNMTLADLQDYQVRVEQPLVGYYHGRKIFTSNSPSSGPVLLSILNILERFNLKEQGRSELNVHRVVEALKFGYAQRTELGDPFFLNINERISQIISKDEASKLRSRLDEKRTHDFVYYGPKFEPVESPGTTHISTLDRNQLAVSLTSTINLIFGAKVMTKNFGILLNNEMDDFSLPNKTNAFGLHPSRNNFIAPGKRPLSSMMPTVIEEDEQVMMVVGASGGSRIISGVVQTIINVLDFNLSINHAVNAPRFHHQLLPNIVYMEDAMEDKFAAALKKFEHKVTRVNSSASLADVQAIWRSKTGEISGAADSRKCGSAKFY